MLKTYVAATNRLANLKQRFKKDQDGAALIEYTVLVGLITVAAVTTIALVGTWVAGKWTALYATINT